ncbi:hypothetical protein A2U01_0055789 [Trifolium medium]|uniref:Uncharacterized protein n=1 Tax=Trifolium medium TaxID=97028 RepID=A0A392RE95_9FABA|nr:hypothetical protein [Trifolium medium]
MKKEISLKNSLTKSSFVFHKDHGLLTWPTSKQPMWHQENIHGNKRKSSSRMPNTIGGMIRTYTEKEATGSCEDVSVRMKQEV